LGDLAGGHAVRVELVGVGEREDDGVQLSEEGEIFGAQRVEGQRQPLVSREAHEAAEVAATEAKRRKRAAAN